MSFKIGFTAETERKGEELRTTVVPKKVNKFIKKSVVDVFFPDRHITCSYYNDSFNLKKGDIVYVDGKLEGIRGRVTNVNYTFKIKLSDYKRVIGVADTDVKGEFYHAGSHLITTDPYALTYEQIIAWFMAPSEEEDVISGEGREVIDLYDLNSMKIDKDTAERGHVYFLQNRVAYIELKDGKGRAIVLGTKPYEVEFECDEGCNITGLVCNCYCTGTCKHEFATMLQLRETLEMICDNYEKMNFGEYLAIVSKTVFYENAIMNKNQGKFILG